MEHDGLFNTDENKALLAICARKLIGNIGIGAVIWGLINIVIGIIALPQSAINVGIVILGVLMLGTGVRALRSPSLGVLLAQTIVTLLLLAWNLGISTINFLFTGIFDPIGLILPLVIAVVFFRYYRKLHCIEQQILSVDRDKLKAIKRICKELLKKKLKKEPAIVETTDYKCRAQLMDDKVFFIHRDLMRAFVAPRDSIRNAIVKLDAKSLRMRFGHPLGKLKYQFDKKSSQKLKNWLSAELDSIKTEPGPPTESN